MSTIITCADPRVDPAHILGLELGDSVVIRNNGGRATKAVREELAALSMMVAQVTGGDGAFEVILMQHTNCGAQRMADPAFQNAMKAKMGIDISETAITDNVADLKADIEKLRAETALPDGMVVSAYLYDIESGLARVVSAPERLR